MSAIKKASVHESQIALKTYEIMKLSLKEINRSITVTCASSLALQLQRDGSCNGSIAERL